jgi:hypothetical protein
MASTGRSIRPVDSDDYEPLNPAAITPGLMTQLQRHAILVWCGLPSLALVQAFVPGVQPTCRRGYTNYLLPLVAIVIAHHTYAESNAWAAAKSLCTQPELCVLRQLGVLRRRRGLVVLGLLQDLDLYANLMFPLIARACDLKIAKQYLFSWEKVPAVGPIMFHVFKHLKFWGTASILMGVSVAVGLRLLCYHSSLRGDIPKKGGSVLDSRRNEGGHPRMLGDDFVSLARYAEVAMMPSVAALCEEMSEQRRHIYDDQKDAKEEALARTKLLLGRLRAEDFQKMELASNEERLKVQANHQLHLAVWLGAKVLIGVVLQMWLQATFFQLSFDIVGREAQYKVVAGMLISVVLVFATAGRFCDVASKLGCVGMLLFLICALIIVWTFAKVYFGVTCSDHLWNLSTGCVDLSEDTGNRT